MYRSVLSLRATEQTGVQSLMKFIEVYRSVLSLRATEQTGVQSLMKFIALDINGDVTELSSRLTNLTPTEKNGTFLWLSFQGISAFYLRTIRACSLRT